jgi:aldose sugar dehydrogenase
MLPVDTRRYLALVIVLTALVAPTSAHAQADVEIVADDLPLVTNMAFAPDGRLFFTEKETGDVRILQGGEVLAAPFAHLPVLGGAERGLLGIALPPDFDRDPRVFIYYTDEPTGRNRLVVIPAQGNRGGAPRTLLELVPASAGYHNGGDLVFGADGNLFAVTGEGHEMARAQDRNDLGGKVLRLRPDGSVPPDNPLGGDSYVYSLGHRNSFGLCIDPRNGQLWETENGPSSDDEVNRIVAGGNYGWPDQLGPGGEPGFIDPALDFPGVIVITGCAVVGPDLWFGDFHGDLHTARIDGDRLVDEQLVAHTGGITDLQLGPDGKLYLSTDSGIIRLAAAVASSPSPATTTPPGPTLVEPDGRGNAVPVILAVAVGALVLGAVVLFLLRRRS